MILRVQNAIPAIASVPTLSALEMDTRYIVGYIHSRGGKRARLYPVQSRRSRVHTPKCHKYLLSGERI